MNWSAILRRWSRNRGLDLAEQAGLKQSLFELGFCPGRLRPFVTWQADFNQRTLVQLDILRQHHHLASYHAMVDYYGSPPSGSIISPSEFYHESPWLPTTLVTG